MVGPTSPLSPVLFDYGVDIIAGVSVIESEKVIRSISEGAIFSQIKGVKLITLKAVSFQRYKLSNERAF